MQLLRDIRTQGVTRDRQIAGVLFVSSGSRLMRGRLPSLQEWTALRVL